MLEKKIHRELLQKIVDLSDLTKPELSLLLDEVYSQSNDVLLTAVLVGLAAKKESVNDIFYVLEWLQSNMVDIPNAPEGAIDTCGTGGSLFNTINVSTIASFIVAEAGIPVIKHGGKSNQGHAGSSDVISALNVPLCKNPQECHKALQKNNLAFLDAPSFHPALASFRLVRSKLGIPTILNTAAALANPARVSKRIIGVYASSLVSKVANILQKSGTEHALVVYGHGGIDEITICKESYIAEVTQHKITYLQVHPSMFAMNVAAPKEIRGMDAKYNAEITQGILSGEITGPYADIVALNAGAGIYIGGQAQTLNDGVLVAKEILKSGRGFKKLQQMNEGLE